MCLDTICFCIKKDTEDDALEALLARSAGHLKAEGIDAVIRTPEEVHPQEHPECLYLTDDPAIAGDIRTQQGKVAGFLHGGNREEKFTGHRFVFDKVDEVDGDSFRKAWERLSGIPWTILKTERLTVRETVLEDLDSFYRIYRDPAMTEFQEGLFENPEDERRYMADYIQKIYGLLGFGVWTVLRTKDLSVIGRAGFSIRQGFDDIELGFMIGRPDQGQGYAYEVCSAILDYGQQVLQLPRVQTLVKEGNEASVHLCRKLGFTPDGEVRIEENIYGDRYGGEGMVSFSPAKYGTYMRFVKEF